MLASASEPIGCGNTRPGRGDARQLAQGLAAARQPRPDRADRHITSRRDFAITSRREPDEEDSGALLFGQRHDRPFEFTKFQVLYLMWRAARSRRKFVPIERGGLTGPAANLADMLVVEDAEQSRSQIRSRFPEMKFREGPSQALLDEIVGSTASRVRLRA